MEQLLPLLSHYQTQIFFLFCLLAKYWTIALQLLAIKLVLKCETQFQAPCCISGKDPQWGGVRLSTPLVGGSIQ